MTRITHRHIEVFRALMLSGSTTKAAELLFTTQPTISRELARIEQVFGFPLFERQKGRLIPTHAALTLFEEIKRTYAGLEQLSSVISHLQQNRQGHISILSLPVFSHSLLPRACQRACHVFPEMNISIQTQESPILEQWLSLQQYDLGLIENRTPPPGTELIFSIKMDEVCIIPAGHPLLSKEIITIDDFDGEDFIAFPLNDPYRIMLDTACSKRSVKRNIRAETPSAVSVCAFVQQGLGLAVVNPLSAFDFKEKGLHIRPLAESFPFSVSVVRASFRPASPLIGEFCTMLQQEVDELTQKIVPAKKPRAIRKA